MSKADAAFENIINAQKIQQKFEFYFVGLVFAILALAVQTANFNNPLISGAAELLSWIALLVSGLAGLSRIEWVPSLLKLHSLQQEREYRIDNIRMHLTQSSGGVLDLDSGKKKSSSSAIEGLEKQIKDIKAKLDPIQRRIERRYTIMRVFFIIGVIALLIARGYGPANSIIRELLDKVS